jgi:hypothetical protein
MAISRVLDWIIPTLISVFGAALIIAVAYGSITSDIKKIEDHEVRIRLLEKTIMDNFATNNLDHQYIKNKLDIISDKLEKIEKK